MQFLINKYFSKLCSEKFFKNNDEEIIGKVKDVIQNLEEQIDFVKNPDNGIDKEDVDFIILNVKELISEINNKYSNKNDIIKIYNHPMSGFYVLQDKKSLLEDLKEYYKEEKEV